MASSLRFGSTPRNLVALFGLAFATASDLRPLTYRYVGVTRRIIMQKARRHTIPPESGTLCYDCL
jgi:hypothetical protein